MNIDQHGSEWANKPSTDSKQCLEDYDEEAHEYDKQLQKWGYRGPKDGALLVQKYIPTVGSVLDAGCGTGLTGEELWKRGFRNITGCDISSKSLEIARLKNIYSELKITDLQKRLNFEDGQFDAVFCIGVLLHIDDGEFLLKEFCRIVKKGGHIVFGQRNDLIEKRNYNQLLKRINEIGFWEKAFESEYLPYIPRNSDYSDRIKVKYFVYKVL